MKNDSSKYQSRLSGVISKLYFVGMALRPKLNDNPLNKNNSYINLQVFASLIKSGYYLSISCDVNTKKVTVPKSAEI